MYGGWTSGYYSVRNEERENMTNHLLLTTFLFVLIQIDLYNELKPFSLRLPYLKNVSSNVVSSLKSVHPSAVWVMQGWLFLEDPETWNSSTTHAFLSGVAPRDMVSSVMTAEVM